MHVSTLMEAGGQADEQQQLAASRCRLRVVNHRHHLFSLFPVFLDSKSPKLILVPHTRSPSPRPVTVVRPRPLFGPPAQIIPTRATPLAVCPQTPRFHSPV